MILLVSLLAIVSVGAEEVEFLDSVQVSGVAGSERVSVQNSKTTSDTATLLNTTPGVSFQTGGGISSLPIIQGMADDRINIQIDGASITSACSNHMNPALSYIDPSKVSVLDVWAGITPVRYGGDSIAGSIIVKSKDLVFSQQSLNLKSFYKSNNENRGASLSYGVANDKWFVGYAGFDESAHNYRDGNGKRIKATLYNQNNQSGTIGRKFDDGVLALKLTRAMVPYQGFINQYMDMADNTSNFANLSYSGLIGKAAIESSLYYQHTNHYMDVLSSERKGPMPMYTRSDESGYNIKASFDLNAKNLMTVGSDYRRFRLNDWWPALPGVTSVMGPNTFESIKNGERDRLGLFIETDSEWTESFSTNLGLRTDIVKMDTGDVQGYNNTDNLPADAAAFNAKSHKKTDNNYDVTLLSKFKANPNYDFELGLARKTRSPNLYERYAWAGATTGLSGMGAAMDMLMINWFGDGNGYTGDIDLKPEVAHKISGSFIAHDEHNKVWETRFTPYYSDVQNFIDADYIGSSMGNNFLRFANHDAVIFGADLSTKNRLLRSSWGDLNLKTLASYTRGYRKDGKADLYHLMPLNGKIILQHAKGKWTSELVTHLVDKKKQVNDMRLEPKTGSYALLDLATNYQLTKLIKIDFGINNVFDLTYGLPLGGVDVVNYMPASKTTVVGMGRSYNAAFSMDFF